MGRRQLTLFIDKRMSENIEYIRQKYNPVQYGLIKSHVTLCREDEITEINIILKTLKKMKHRPISINFGPAIRFSDGKGIYIPAVGDIAPFHNLRKTILQAIIPVPRQTEPHITLIHPRNGTCTDSIFKHIKELTLPDQLEFSTISLIEQEEGQEWNTIEEFEMRG